MTSTLRCRRSPHRMGTMMSVGERVARRDLIEQRLEEMVFVRSTSVTSTAARLSRRAAVNPPNRRQR